MEQVDIVYPAPALKWAGGKRWLIQELKKWYSPERRLVDPFIGGMSIPLGLGVRRALINDVNPHLMNFYMHLKNGLRKTQEFDNIEFRNDADTYYRNRNLFNSLCDSRQYWTTEGALLFYYLNKTGFNGLCRFNRSGQFNTPFGSHKSVHYCTDFSSFIEPMREWSLMFGDFESLPIEPDDFIYADPPYDVEFTQFAQRDFTWEDQKRLARWLAAHPGPVVASNQATPRIVELYESHGFILYSLSGPRAISANGDRTPAMEVLAVKAAA